MILPFDVLNPFSLNTLVAAVRSGTQGIAGLFRNGEQGVWYDPSDTTTLFQDSAGTTPVTASGQPVGLMLDKSKGLVLGPEFLQNRDFSNGLTNWTVTTAGQTVEVVGGRLHIITDGTGAGVNQPLLTAGKTYKIEGDYEAVSGSLKVQVGSATAVVLTTTGRFSSIFRADGGNFFLYRDGGAAEGYFDNISVRELPGNHATQPTAASRPIYRRGDSRGVVNQLTWSEDFSNAGWNRSDTTVSAGLTFGGYSTQLLTQGSAGTGFVTQLTSANRQAGEVTASRVFARGDSDWVLLIVGDTGAAANAGRAWFNLASGTKGTATVVGTATGVTSDIVPVTGGAYRCTVSATIPGTTANSVSQIVFSDGSTGRKSGNRYEGAAQLNLGPTALPYQRNDANLGGVATGASTDLHWLETDGVDDGMATGNIDFTGTDKVSVFAGVRKLSDAAAGLVAELSATSDLNNGSFGVLSSGNTGGLTPARNTWTTSIRGTLREFFSATGYVSPVSSAVTARLDLSAATPAGARVDNRIDGSVKSSVTIDGPAGAGIFGNYPLYLFRRGGTTLPFNGRFYGLAITGRLTTDAETVATERFLAAKSGVVIP